MKTTRKRLIVILTIGVALIAVVHYGYGAVIRGADRHLACFDNATRWDKIPLSEQAQWQAKLVNGTACK